MKPKYIPLVLVCFLLFGLAVQVITRQIQQERLQKRRIILGDLFFKGRVINSKIYDYGGRNYRLVCLKLDSGNRKDLYIFNDRCAIKIKDSIATFSAGGDDPNFVIDYIMVNVQKNVSTYHYKNGNTTTDVIDLEPQGLSVSDMNFCR
ncbi:hypothetical protein C8P68_106155 [Mucilaginibacter yixingensis]|uniref:Uncharacterized protein n=1 Tax=Mucilaginibacter yixingensis TaxID=1295612 RepID=A0A2T5J786_9SPHI|nr:hypothetical protein [Mucilaginibacter yixingensis]PTQ94941.1 hypothetical protein C8P68_106155 [Mucilaginibacter yixingensis]